MNGDVLEIDRREVVEVCFFAPNDLPDELLRTHSELIWLAVRSALP